MKRYPAYKDSGVEWFTKVPSSWELKRLKHVSEVVNGSTPKSGIAEYWDGDVVWITPNDLGHLNGSKAQDSLKKITTEGLNSCGSTLTPPGSIILSTRAPIGHIALTSVETCTNQGCKTIIPNNMEPNNGFIFYYLLSSKPNLQSLGRGSTFTELSSQNLKDVILPLPPNKEQRTIVKYLDHKTHLIDTLIEKKQKQIELLQEQRVASINQAVTKGLNPNVKMKDSGIEWLGEVPEHWNILKLKHLLRVKDGTHATPPYVEPSELAYPLVTSKDIKDGNINFSEAKFISEEDHFEVNKRSDVQEGDVIMPMIGTIGNPAIVKTARKFSIKNVALFKSSNSAVGPRYICFFLLSDCVAKQFNLLSRGGVQGFVSLDILRNLVAFKLGQNEQKQTVKYLDLVTAKIDNNINAINTIIERLSEYRTTLISEVVTGKIDVRNEVIP